MPVNVAVGLGALLVALVLYSLGVIGAFRAKAISKRQVTYVWIGFAFDVLATLMMAITKEGLRLDLEPAADLMHTVVALVAMFGMLAVAIVGGRAVSKPDAKLAGSVAKWALAPWALWVFVFLWGMAARGPMGG